LELVWVKVQSAVLGVGRGDLIEADHEGDCVRPSWE
jgi:hypothetical protein